MEGTLLGDRYRLGPVIGVGGMGAVHRARDEVLGRDVAIKILRTGAPAADAERLHREAEYLGSVQHPNLVSVVDVGTGEAVWFAMELITGPDLRTLLQDRGPMGGPAVRRVLGDILGALGAMHAVGLVHRDVSPANILLTADPFARWDAKLADLGIARRPLTVPLTEAGRIVGTAAYLSPEQVAGGEIGPATDVYALALVALEALTGTTPFPGSAMESAMARVVRAPDVPTSLHPAWQEVLRSATSIDQRSRPTAGDLAAAVGGLPDGAWIGGSPRRSTTSVLVPLEARAIALPTTRTLPVLTTSVLTVPPQHRPRRSRTLGLLLSASALVIVCAALAGTVSLIRSVAAGDTAAITTTRQSPATSSTPRATTADGASADEVAAAPTTAPTEAAAAAAPGSGPQAPVDARGPGGGGPGGGDPGAADGPGAPVAP